MYLAFEVNLDTEAARENPVAEGQRILADVAARLAVRGTVSGTLTAEDGAVVGYWQFDPTNDDWD